jgi:hypothetical protein
MITVTADELPRFMACNGSRLLPASLPAAVADTTARDEGIAAHYLALAVFRNEFTIDELVDRKAPNGVYITLEMVEHVQTYLDAIIHLDRGKIVSDAEIDTSFGTDAFRVNARADHIAISSDATADQSLYIDDFKYGWRLVDPENNWTLIAHAIGYCLSRQVTPARIVLTIHQPRPYHPEGKSRPWEITYSDLLDRYAHIKMTLENPSDQLNTGSHCGKCPALATCPAARKANMNAIDASEMAYSDELDNGALSHALNTLRAAQSALNTRLDALEELAKFRLKSGEVLDGYGVENQLSNTDWKPGIDVAMIEMLTGKNIAKSKLPTPGQAIKAGIPEAVIKPLTERRLTGVKLVRVDANRKAQKLFGNQKGI